METKIITLDELAAIYDGMTNPKRTDAGSGVVFTGDHPEYGTVVLVQCGDSVVLVYDRVRFIESGDTPTPALGFIAEAA